MGAAAAPHSAVDGYALAEEFVGGEPNETLISPRWPSLLTKIPLVVPTALALHAKGSTSFRIWASGQDAPLTYSVTNGGSAWSVASTCPATLRAGHACAFTVTNLVPGAGVDSGTVAINGPNGRSSVEFSILQSRPHVSARADRLHVRMGRHITIRGLLKTAADAAVKAHVVTLEEKPANYASWLLVAHRATTHLGRVAFVTAPSINAEYRLVSAEADGYPLTHSAKVKVTVAPLVRVRISRRHLGIGATEFYYCRIPLVPRGGTVKLEYRLHGRWQLWTKAPGPIEGGRIIFYSYSFVAATTKWRVVTSPSKYFSAGHSRTITVRWS